MSHARPAYPLPPDEDERLAALKRCRVVDTSPERLFDDIAQLASQLCATPIALVSLVDRSRQWFKARVGLELSETPRSASLCAHAIVAKGPLVVRDALADPRFADNPLVTGEPHVRFYAAVPLVVEGDYALGTVCVMDTVPRELSRPQLEALEVLARRASAELSLRTRLGPLSDSSAARRESMRDAYDGTASSPRETQHPTMNYPGARRERARAAALPVPVGAIVGERYRIERKIGAGGMGIVAAAYDLRRKGRVAIKFMRVNALADPSALRRFAREAQVLVSLDSQHVARVLDFGRLEDGAPFIVMEYLEGRDLAEHLRMLGRLSVPEALDIMLQACAAIRGAHDQGIFHRDLKPANLFLTGADRPVGTLKVLDFGISKMAAEEGQLETALTGEATELGSPTYMSPEQMLGAADVDARSDVWSLGIVLYELLAGRPPFTGPNRLEVCANVLTSPVPPLQTLRPELPPALIAAVERCLQRSAEARFQSVGELGVALHRIANSLRSSAQSAYSGG